MPIKNVVVIFAQLYAAVHTVDDWSQVRKVRITGSDSYHAQQKTNTQKSMRGYHNYNPCSNSSNKASKLASKRRSARYTSSGGVYIPRATLRSRYACSRCILR